jgi:hypothetical protein
MHLVLRCNTDTQRVMYALSPLAVEGASNVDMTNTKWMVASNNLQKVKARSDAGVKHAVSYLFSCCCDCCMAYSRADSSMALISSSEKLT